MTEPQPHLLSPIQRRIVAAGATALALVLLVGTLYFCFELLRRFVATFQDVLLPLALAAILATLLRPILRSLESHARLSRLQSIALLYLLVLLALAAAAVLLVPVLFEQISEFSRHAPELRDNFLEFVKSSLPAAWEWLTEQLGQPPDDYLKSVFAENTGWIQDVLIHLRDTMDSIGGFFGGLFGKIAAYAILPVYLFFILGGNRDVWNEFDKQLNFLPRDRREDLVFLGRQFSDILIAFFRGQILIGLLLGLVLATGFALVGLKFGILLGFFLGLLNIVPYLGTMLGLLTVLPLAYFQEGGSVQILLLAAGVFALGQILTDYVFTPRIMGDKTGMGPILIIFSVFFWGTALGGILGMILAIPLTAFFLVFWRLLREKYLPALTARSGAENAGSSS